MNRDLQIKHVKEMYRSINGNYPHHMDFDNMDDDVLETMFITMRDQIDERDRQRRQLQDNSELHGFMIGTPSPSPFAALKNFLKG